MSGFLQQTLEELFAEYPGQIYTPIPADLDITGISLDSRQVQPGHLFVALTGENTDGHRYISNAVEHGAVAVVGTAALENQPVPYVRVDDARLALASLSAAFYQFPARRLTVIGVTGTDGKTTTCNLIYQILLTAGLNTGIISTVNATIGGEILDTGFHVTTPEAPDVQRYLYRMVSAGLTHVVLEATSHGLAQQRVTGCEFDIGVITNITHEHLDYHGSFAAYRAIKASLLTSLAATSTKPQGNPRLAVLNRDDPSYDYLASITPMRKIDYSQEQAADLVAKDIQFGPDGLHFRAVGPGLDLPISSKLLGSFNISNCLAALAATVAGLNIPPEAAQAGIAALASVPGRMECINLGQDFLAIVDFAHTPNALKRALEAARQMTSGRVLAVFGSAGLRDREKRRMMAEVSSELADTTVLTAEDPRTESLDSILEEMADGARKRGGVEGETFWRVSDRGEAIRFAVSKARPGDLVITCGKGHEQSMCFGTVEYHWDDRIALRAALSELLGLQGPEMPHLPTS